MSLKNIEYLPLTGEFLSKNGSLLKIGRMGGKSDSGGEYLVIYLEGKNRYVHRLAFFLMTGEWPKLHVDHINGIKTDNRWCNLRLATMAQNKANEGIRRSNTSGWKGVSFCKQTGKWRSYIGGKMRHIGRYDCPAAAHMAYLVEANKSYGEFARS